MKGINAERRLNVRDGVQQSHPTSCAEIHGFIAGLVLYDGVVDQLARNVALELHWHEDDLAVSRLGHLLYCCHRRVSVKVARHKRDTHRPQAA